MVNIPIFILYFYFCIFKMVQSDIINNPIQTDIKHNALNYYISFELYNTEILNSKEIKIMKENNSLKIGGKSITFSPNLLICIDESNNKYLFTENIFYRIVISSNNIISFSSIRSIPNLNNYTVFGYIKEKKYDDNSRLEGDKCSINKNEIILYGIKNNYLYFYYIEENKGNEIQFDYKINTISCRLLESAFYLCVLDQNNKIYVVILAYIYDARQNKQLIKHSSIIPVNDIEYYRKVILFNTDHSKIKILCNKNMKNFDDSCIIIKTDISYSFFGYNALIEFNSLMKYNTKFIYNENNCYFISFNWEYLLCCGTTNQISCQRKNINFELIYNFKLNLSGQISNLIIENNIDHATLLYFDESSDEKYLFKYYIYPPKCKEIVIEISSFGEVEIILFEKKTNSNYYIRFFNLPMDFGYLSINGDKVKSIRQNILILDEKVNLSFTSTTNKITDNFKIKYEISIEETYSSKCNIFLTIKPCYKSCKRCKWINNNHICTLCKEEEGYYPFLQDNSNCYTIQEIVENHPNWYLNMIKKQFDECDLECRTCKGPTREDCLSCDNEKFLYNGKCLTECPKKTAKSQDIHGYKICVDCYENCETCSEKGNPKIMNCLTCKEDKIIYYYEKNGLKFANCLKIYDNKIKSFYDPENSNKITSCLQLYNKYIIENSKECIDLPNNEYFISNKVTGLLTPCHPSCLTCSKKFTENNPNCDIYKKRSLQEIQQFGSCENGYYWKSIECLPCYKNCETCETGEIYDNVGKLNNMKCIKCSNVQNSPGNSGNSGGQGGGDGNHVQNPEIARRYLQNVNGDLVNENLKIENTMIKNEENCFPIIIYNDSTIIFDISEIDERKPSGTCLGFNKAIFQNTYECIEKPENTFYILNDEGKNTGVIGECSNNCASCYGEANKTDSNCIKCSSGYYKTEDSNTNCIMERNIPNGYYKNTTDNIYYHCHPNCSSCSNGYDPLSDEMNCIICQTNFYKLNGTNNCYKTLNNNFYFKENIFYPCDENCLTCSDGKNNISNNCLSCDNLKKELYLVLDLNNCEYSNYSGYYLDHEDLMLKRCYNSCKSCFGPLEINNDINEENNHNCIECAENYYKLSNSLYRNNCYNIEVIGVSESDTWNQYNIPKEISTTWNIIINKTIGNFKVNMLNSENSDLNSNKNCYPACSICYDFPVFDEKGNIIKQNCIDCIKGYNFIYETNNCVNDSILDQGYFFSSNDSMYYKCNIQCKTCSENRILNIPFCLTCNNEQGYYFAENKSSTLCFNNVTIENYYFLGLYYDSNGNIVNKKWTLCYSTCASCSYSGNNSFHNCNTCKPDHYFLDNTKNCVNMEYAANNGYFLNTINYVFQKCDKACSKCISAYENDNTNCIECNNEKGYYLVFDSDTNNCYNNQTIKKGYYLDMKEYPYVWKKCYEKCQKCYKLGNSTNMNCLSCRTNLLLTLSGDCVSDCPNGTIQFSLNKTCLESCPNNYEVNKENNVCIIKSFDKTTLLSDFKIQVMDNIISYANLFNSSILINGYDFIAIFLSSNEINQKERLKNGISSIDLGNCPQVLQKHYNISENESLIILNIESKKDEERNDHNKDNSFNIVNKINIEIFDMSGRRLDLSICKEDIKIKKYLGDIGEINIELVKNYADIGIDVFNASDEFFNSLCYKYNNKEGKDITIEDRRTYIFQNVTFCQEGCTYEGMDLELITANCICKTNSFQDKMNNITNDDIAEYNRLHFKDLVKSFIANWLDFNIDVIYCYNLVFNIPIIKVNIGFIFMISLFLFQIIFLIIFLIKKLKPIKNFMIASKKNNNMYILGNPNKKQKTYNEIKENNNNKKVNKNIIKLKLVNDDKFINNMKNLKIKKNIFGLKRDNNNILNLRYQNYKINDIKKNKKILLNSGQVESSNRNLLKNISKKKSMDNLAPIIFLQKENCNNLFSKKNSLKLKENINKINKKNAKKSLTIKNKINNHINSNKIILINNKKFNSRKVGRNEFTCKLSQNDENLQDLDFEVAIIKDNRTFLRIYWSFLVDSQIILGTFFTENYLELLIIKLTFLLLNFQINFFLNALFYTDEYISESYHNDGILDFFTGLPKAIYSFVATLLITNLLQMLSSSKSELMQIIRDKNKYKKNYISIINAKLKKLRIKLIIYFIISFLLGLFFFYYVAAFCAVYRYSQKYWFYGCLESFVIDTITCFLVCIILSLLRFIAIHKKIKYLYIMANIINKFV